MFDRLTARPLVQRGLGVATAGLLIAGSLLVPAAVHAAGNAPVANDDLLTGVHAATEDTPLVFDASLLLANDTNGDGGTGTGDLSVTAVTDDTNGHVGMVGTTITFTPLANDCAPSQGTFTYDMTDGIDGTRVGTVTVDITCVNDAPVANPDTVPGHEDDQLVITDHDLVANDDDIDNGSGQLFIAGASGATNGSVSYDSVSHNVTFTPTPGVCSPTDGGFTYTVSDGDKTDTSTVTVTLMCNGTDHAPIAANHTKGGTEDTAVVSTLASLLAGATDADADPLLISGVSNFVGGTAVLGATDVTFTPAANLCGADVASYDYTVNDGQGGTDLGTLTISLTCTNDAPVAVADSGSVDANSGPASYDVLANDTDVDGDTLALQAPLTVSPPTAGTASYVLGKVQFTPTAVFHGQATITYHVSDGTVAVAGTLKVDVGVDLTAPVVAVPTAAFGSGRVNESAPIRINWSATDANSGVATYQLQVSVGGASFKNVYVGTGKTITKSYPFGKTLVWRVRATDHDGNLSGWVSSATRKIVAVQENNRAIVRTGTWSRVITRGASGTGYGFTAKNHKAAGVLFTGRSVLYVAPKSTAAGFVKVYVDGHLVGRFNVHSRSFIQGRIIARASWAASGTHTIVIVNDQAGKRANLDAFIVLR